MARHLQGASISFATAALLFTSCGVSHNKISYSTKKAQSNPTTHAKVRFEESPDKTLLSINVSDAKELKPLSTKHIKNNNSFVAPIIDKEDAKTPGTKMINTTVEGRTQEAKFKIDEESQSEEPTVQNDQEEPRHVRIKKRGKLFMLISLGSMSLTFLFLILGFAGVITAPAIGILMAIFAIAAVLFLIIGLFTLIVAAATKHKADKAEQ